MCFKKEINLSKIKEEKLKNDIFIKKQIDTNKYSSDNHLEEEKFDSEEISVSKKIYDSYGSPNEDSDNESLAIDKVEVKKPKF